MSPQSIFDKIVRDENDYTQLLVNLMVRDDEFRRQILGLFLAVDLAAKAPANAIQAQVNIRDETCLGRPDIEIRWGGIRIFVEVKIHAWTGITENQDVTSTAKKDFEGYLGSLSRSPEERRWLVYLVPRRWNYCAAISRGRADKTGVLSAANIHVETIFWEDVLDILEHVDHCLNDPLLQEFAALLFAHLQLIRLNREEADMLFSNEFATAYQTIRKTEQLIDQVQAFSAERFSNLTMESSSSTKTARFHEYGFYPRTKSGQYLLWVGVWAEFSAQHRCPISVGVEHDADKDEKLRKAFRAVWPGGTVEFDHYTVGWFTRDIFESDDPGKRMFELLAPAISKVSEAAALRKKVGAGTRD